MLKLTTSWEELKEKIKEANNQLTDADLFYNPRNEKKLLRHLAKKMNRSEEEIKGWIESIAINQGKAS